MALGATQYKIEIIRLTMISSTGHFAMSQTVTAVEPMPSTWPTWLASPPVTTTMSADATSSTMISTVTPMRTGVIFQNGLPSGTSQTTLAARMNAAM